MASSTSSGTNVSLETFLCERSCALPSSVISWLKKDVRMGDFKVGEDENEDIGTFIQNQRLNVARQLQRAYRAIKYGEMQAVDSPCSRTLSIHSRFRSMVQMDEATHGLFNVSIIVYTILMLDQLLVSGEMKSHFDMLLVEMTDNLDEETSLAANVSTDVISVTAALQQEFELLNYIRRHRERFESSSANNLIAVKLIDWMKK